MEPKIEKNLLSCGDLLKRGWTNGLITKYLPEPDATTDNPVFRYAGAPKRHYDPLRVKRIEGTTKFKQDLERTKRHKLAAAKANQTKQEKLDNFLLELEIDVPDFEEAHLFHIASEHYKNLDRSTNSDVSTRDNEFLHRIAVNYLRHCCTKYEDTLDKLAGKIGARDARYDVKARVLSCISRAYPRLRAECERQVDRMNQQRGIEEMERSKGDYR